jgi:protein-L-isoaspartate(D-aspartate) O-methyltransferase
VPQARVDQVKEGGQMVIPVGQRYQQTLYLLKKVKGKMVSETLLPVLFVPMTGAAEGLRRVQPDPLRPALENGDFEKVKGDPRQPVGWYYQRQLTVVSDGESPSGKKNYVAFRNSEPGRGCQALQGFAVDGRKIHKLNVSLMIRGRKISAGQAPDQVAALVITFYAENRATLTQTGIMGPWVGSFDWQSEGKLIEVPIRAREAILRIGLMGGVGELDVDKVELKAAKNKGEGGGGKAEGRGHR